MNSERLKDFRQAAYELLVRALVCDIRADGCSNDDQECGLRGRNFRSVRYSIVTGNRVYEALQDSRPDRKKLMLLYLQQLEQESPPTEHLLVAIDHTVWGRPEAKTLKDRTHEYQAGVIIGLSIQYNCVDTRNRRKLGITPTT